MGDGQKVMDGFKFLKICSKKRQAKKVTFSQKYVQFCDKCLKTIKSIFLNNFHGWNG